MLINAALKTKNVVMLLFVFLHRNTSTDHCKPLKFSAVKICNKTNSVSANISILGTLITIYVLCTIPYYSVDDRAYEFSQDELIVQSEIEDTILCPGHQARLRLSQLAPDIVLGDLDPKFNLIMEKFVFVPRCVKLELGDCYSVLQNVFSSRFQQ